MFKKKSFYCLLSELRVSSTKRRPNVWKSAQGIYFLEWFLQASQSLVISVLGLFGNHWPGLAYTCIAELMDWCSYIRGMPSGTEFCLLLGPVQRFKCWRDMIFFLPFCINWSLYIGNYLKQYIETFFSSAFTTCYKDKNSYIFSKLNLISKKKILFNNKIYKCEENDKFLFDGRTHILPAVKSPFRSKKALDCGILSFGNFVSVLLEIVCRL